MISRLSSLAAAVVLGLSATALAAKEIPLGNYEDWDTYVFVGSGKHCSARSFLLNVGFIELSVTEDGRTFFGIYLMTKTTDEKLVDVSLYIDEKEWDFGTQRSEPGGELTFLDVLLSDKDVEPFVTDLQSGHSVSIINADGDPVTWSLRGADLAIARMARCYREIRAD